MGARCFVASWSKVRDRGSTGVRAERVFWIPLLTLMFVLAACTKYRVAPSDGGDALAPDGASPDGSGGSSGTGGGVMGGSSGTGGAGTGGTRDAAGSETTSDAPIDAPAD